MRIRKYENPAVKKAWKITTIFVSIFVFVPCLALMTFGVLYLAGVIDLTNDNARVYTVQFYDSETQHVYFQTTKTRGEKFSYKEKPYKAGYTFRGWDTNGDTFADIIPTRVYGDIYAKALWAPIIQGGWNASH